MTDKRGFINETQARSILRNGRKLTPDEMAAQLALCKEDSRVAAMEEFEADEDLTLAERLSYGRAMYGTIERLRKAGID